MDGVVLLYWNIFLLITTPVTFGDLTEPTKYDLIHYLLDTSRYDNHFPPNAENVTDVSVKLYITDLDSESDKNMEIGFTLFLRMNWTDERLDFSINETSYDKINLGDDIIDSLWIPDLYFTHERTSELHGLFNKNQFVYIHKNGQVLYSGRFFIKSQCYMNFTNYPFDTQNCPIEIQSYAYTSNFIHLHWNGDDAVYIDHGINSLSNPVASPQYQGHEYRQKYPSIGSFSTLTTEIRFERQRGSYGITIIAPPVIVVMISLMSFYLDVKDTSRITIPTGGLTQLFVQWAGIYNLLSLDSTTDYLDMWMLGNIFFVGIILMLNILIIHHKYKKTQRRQQRKGRKNGNDKVKNGFWDLLDEREDIKTSMGFNEVRNQIKNDNRFKRAFENYETDIVRIYDKFIEEKKKVDFLALLDEKAFLVSEWDDAKMLIDHDYRFEVVGNNDDKKQKQWFNEHWKENRILQLFNKVEKLLKFYFNAASFLIVAGVYLAFLAIHLCIWVANHVITLRHFAKPQSNNTLQFRL